MVSVDRVQGCNCHSLFCHVEVLQAPAIFKTSGDFLVNLEDLRLTDTNFLSSKYPLATKQCHNAMVVEFAARIQALPAELFNQIRDEVLNCNHVGPANGCVKYIRITSPEFKFPVALQISRYHREQPAAAYFSNTVFICSDADVFYHFTSVIEDSHFAMIAGYRVGGTAGGSVGGKPGDLVRRVLARAEKINLVMSRRFSTIKALRQAGEPFETEADGRLGHRGLFHYVLTNQDPRTEQ